MYFVSTGCWVTGCLLSEMFFKFYNRNQKPITSNKNPYLRNMLPKYKRILLKVSGESLMGDKSFGLDADVISHYAQDIKSIVELNVQVAIVIGGGNMYRGMNE